MINQLEPNVMAQEASVNLTEKALELKSKITDALGQWGNNLIDTFVADKPKLKPLSVYMKRGLTNGLVRYDGKVQNAVDNMMMFVTDEEGNYDMNQVFEDAMSMFKEMDDMKVNLGPLDATIGKGIIKIHVPDNIFTSMLFGKTGAIKITESDILELKNLFLEE